MYDTQESRYITLRDIRRLVREDIGFQVFDKRHGKDITGQILLQVIMEQERSEKILLTLGFLNSLIRGYEDPSCELIAGYLEQSLRLLLRYKQHILVSNANQPMQNKDNNAQTLEYLSRMQEAMFQRLTKPKNQ